MIVLQTDHRNNIKITNHFAKGCNGKIINIKDYVFNDTDTVSSYGILRGTGNVFKKANSFYYIDHGYLSASGRSFSNDKTIFKDFDGYFRIVYNDFIGFKIDRKDERRLEKLNIEFKKKENNRRVYYFI